MDNLSDNKRIQATNIRIESFLAGNLAKLFKRSASKVFQSDLLEKLGLVLGKRFFVAQVESCLFWFSGIMCSISSRDA